MINDKKGRLSELDALRGIACLMVFFYHHSIRFTPNDTHFIFHYGYLGVHLFFMISGFVIFLTLERSQWFDFLVHRLTRLYPAYWICVLLTFLIMTLSPFSKEIPTNFNLYANLTMLQHWIGVRDLDLAYWSLNYELSFYFFMIMVLLIGQLNNYKAIVLLMIAPIWLKVLFPSFIEEYIFKWITFLNAGHLFAAGIIFYHIYKRGGKPTLSEVVLLLICLISDMMVKATFDLVEFIYTIFFFATFLFLSAKKLNWIATPTLLFYGQISYSLYLIHENVGLEVLKALEYWGINNWYITRGVLLLLFTTICYLITKYFEQPTQRWLNYTWKELKSLGTKMIILTKAG